MKRFTRREILRGFAAGPAALYFASLARAASTWQIDRPDSPFERLNVLFHGLSILDFGQSEVRVYLPDAGPDRAYLAGDWMQEIALDRGAEYRLSGVVTGPRPGFEAIDPHQNAVFSGLKVNANLSYCRMAFPFPDFVTPLRLVRESHGKHFFMGTPPPVVQPKMVPEIVAFTYVHPDSTSPLEFRPLPWTPVIVEGVVNLHVWNEPAKRSSNAAAIRAFEQTAQMLGSPALALNPIYAGSKPPQPDSKPEIQGLGCEQEWSLTERMSAPEGCGKGPKYRPKDDWDWDGLPILIF